MKKFVLIGIILLAALLRFYNLGSTPPSLYWDEASLGYNAYSILETGHDEHGQFMPLTNFAAFGDYKPPGYIYAAVLSIVAFGLNEFSIRFPSAAFGVLTVILSYFLAKKLFKNEIVSLLTAFFLAISPWHIQLSRAAFEANLALFFSTLGIFAFIKFATEKPPFIFLSVISFIIAIYTFTGQRLFVPFILLVLAVQFRKEIISNFKIVLSAAIISAFLFWPLFIFATQTIEGRLRFNEVSIFKDLEPSDRSTRYRDRDDFSWWSNFIHNRRFVYAREYLIHYFDAFNPSFLFIKGDVNPRLSAQEVGQLYIVDLFLILPGIYFLAKNNTPYRFLILGWLIVSPLGPATARETPHALRMIHILPTFQILSAYGFYNLYKIIKFKKVFTFSVLAFLILNLFYYLHMYYLHWPKNFSGYWQYGYKQAVETAKSKYQDFDHIVVTKYLGRPYVYFLLYMQFDPNTYRGSAQIKKDQFYFIDVDGFDKFIFTESPDQTQAKGKILFITPPDQLPEDSQKIETIRELDGSSVFDIGEAQR